jgi:hypothetical protein
MWEHHRALVDDLPDQISERTIDPEDLAFLPPHGSGFPLLEAWLSCHKLSTRDLDEDKEDEGPVDERRREPMAGLYWALPRLLRACLGYLRLGKNMN